MILDSIVVPLVADIKKYQDGLDKAVKQTQTSTQTMGNNIGDMTKKASVALSNLAIAGIGTLVGAITGAIVKTIDWREAVDETTKALGTTTEESSGLALLADRVGMSAGDITESLMKMTKGLGDSQAALGPTGKALESLGIKAFDASGKIKPATTILQEVSDKLGDMPNSLDKTSLEMDIFGKSGASMNEILELASNGGMQNFITQADKMGLAMSSEQSAKVEEFNRASATFKETLNGIAISIGNKVIPQLTPFLDKLSTLAFTYLPPIIDFVGNHLNVILGVLGTILAVTVIPRIVAFTAATWASNVALLANPITWVLLGLGLLATGIVLLTTNYQNNTTAIEDDTRATNLHNVEQWNAIDAQNNLNLLRGIAGVNSLDGNSEALKRNYQAIFDNNQVATNQISTIGTITDLFRTWSLEVIWNKLAVDMDAESALNLAIQWGLVDQSAIAQKNSIDLLTGAQSKNKDGLVVLTEQSNLYLATLTWIKDQATLLTSKTWDMNFVVHVLGASMPAIPDQSSTPSGGIPGGYSQYSPTGEYGGNDYYWDNGWKKIPGHAFGGDFPANKPFKAGENGVEIITPKTAGTVTPNNKIWDGFPMDKFIIGMRDAMVKVMG